MIDDSNRAQEFAQEILKEQERIFGDGFASTILTVYVPDGHTRIKRVMCLLWRGDARRGTPEGTPGFFASCVLEVMKDWPDPKAGVDLDVELLVLRDAIEIKQKSPASLSRGPIHGRLDRLGYPVMENE